MALATSMIVMLLESRVLWPQEEVALLTKNFIYEHVYSHKAAQKKRKKRTAQKTAIYSLTYIYIKQVVHQLNS